MNSKCENCEDTGVVKEICFLCNGSGEGMYDGSTCYACKGTGIEYVKCTECELTPAEESWV